MPRLPRMALVFLMAAILATTAALADPLGRAQPRRSAISASASSGLATQLWSFLIRAWTKNGSQVDPSGVPIKNGSMVEPNGSSLQIPVSVLPNEDNGHQVDPDG